MTKPNKHFLEIAKNSAVETFNPKIWKFFVPNIGGATTTLLICKNLFGWEVLKSSIISACILVLSYTIRYIYIYLKNAESYWRNVYADNIYGDAIVELKSIFSKVHMLRRVKPYSEELYKGTMEFACTSIRKIFESRTQKTCSVSIKVLAFPNKSNRAIGKNKSLDKGALVVNVFRDAGSKEIRSSEKYDRTEHHIVDNTCFTVVFNNIINYHNEPEKWYFLCNDIKGLNHYLNSSKSVHQDGNLPYNSELVVPIIPLYLGGLNNHDLIGFLCVDSPDALFDSKYDTEILLGAAEGLYDSIKFYLSQTNRKEKQKDQVQPNTPKSILNKKRSGNDKRKTNPQAPGNG